MLGTPFRWTISRNCISELYRILRGHTLKISNIAWSLAGTIPRGNRKFSNDIGINFSSKFHSYLAGLIDGDGCLHIPKKYRDNNNKIISPQITIAFNSKDLPLALLLQQNLNMGQIYKIKGKNAYYYRISNLKNLIKVINLINGYMRTPKINQLYNLIDYINARGFNIKKLPLDNSSLNSNAWLSGFIDAANKKRDYRIKSSNIQKNELPFHLKNIIIGLLLGDLNCQKLTPP